MRFTLREHGFMALQGLTLFSINYILVYVAELHLAGGYVAIVFSLIVVLNVLFGAAFLKNPVRPRVLLGGAIGIVGLSMVFLPGLGGLSLSAGAGLGLVLALVGTIIASLGNMVSARNQRHKIPVVQANAYGMGYGALITLGIAVVRGSEVSFDASPEYVLSLLYLALFGSVIAFGSYLTILGRIGPDRAGYIAVLFPIVALLFSTAFEGLTWELITILGRRSGPCRKRHRDDSKAPCSVSTFSVPIFLSLTLEQLKLALDARASASDRTAPGGHRPLPAGLRRPVDRWHKLWLAFA